MCQICSSKLQIIYQTKNFLAASFVDENYLLKVLYKTKLICSYNFYLFILDKYDSIMHKLTIAIR